MSSSPILHSKAWLVVALLWLVAALNYLDRLMVTTMRGSLLQAIPMTDAQFGLLTSMFLWVYGALSPFTGFLADRFSRRVVIVTSLFVWSALTWLTGQAKSYEQLVLIRSLMGVSEACYLPAALALITDFHQGPTRSLATGIHMTGITVGSGLGGLGGWFAERHGWSFPFSLFGMIGVVYSIGLLFLLPDAPREPADGGAAEPGNAIQFRAALRSLFARGSFVIAMLYWGLLGLAGWALAGWLPTYLNEQFHLTQGVAGLSATGYLQAASFVGLLIGGFCADRWSRINERGRMWVPAIGLCLAAPGILLAANASVLGLAIAGLIFYGLTRASTDANMMPVLCLVCDPRYRATGYGLLNLCGCFVGGLTIYAGGALRDAHVDVRSVFQVAAFSLLVCAGLLCLLKPTARTLVAATQEQGPTARV
jgi:MFS family permease